ncbi:hypothetical protein [uncultured Tateyamaria sp.]|uniref:hypothetical protein n=1 Tax=Tateyamaria sp. 1078 TaxID=3417464 RepID=UPI00262F7607|nr:hypothetical protein [uncultured Tateyamaria sp.]
MSDMTMFAIPAGIALVAGVFGWLTVHLRAKPLFWSVLGLIAVVSLGLFMAATQASGWDGLAYMIILLFGGLPAAAAQLIGGGVGLVTRQQLPLPS